MDHKNFLISLCTSIAGLQKTAIALGRLSIAVILIWIGGLKFFDYEAEGIVPFVANSPFMSFFYSSPDKYHGKILKEGEADAENHSWHVQNNTYGYSYGLGALLVCMGGLLIMHHVNPLFGVIGSVLVIIMSFGTLSFLITTPETWVPNLGGSDHGFPYLSGRGRLVIKDLIMMMTAFITLTDSAQLFLRKNRLVAPVRTEHTTS